MGYEALEVSTYNGKPIELYRFDGEYQTYLYTSCEIDQIITVPGEGEGGSDAILTFFAIPIKRGAMKVGTQDDDKLDLTVELPVQTSPQELLLYRNGLVQDYGFQTSPPSLRLRIFRVHRGDGDLITYFDGFVTSFKIAGAVAILQTPSILASALDGSVPSVHYQTPCNHVLYDPDTCGVSRAAHTVVTFAMTIDGRDVWIDSAGGKPDGYFEGGEILSTESGERRMVVQHVGQYCKITYPFAELVVGAPIEVVAGCDHDWGGHCLSRFNNQLRCGCYGKWTPPDNPFVSGID